MMFPNTQFGGGQVYKGHYYTTPRGTGIGKYDIEIFTTSILSFPKTSYKIHSVLHLKRKLDGY